jgi:hypothetical protein
MSKRKPFDPFHKVCCKYGAPMGRRDAKHILSVWDGCLIARHCGGTDCYDKGGAYWGAPLDIWAVWNRGKGPETVTYVRADNAKQAKNFAVGRTST